MKNYAHIKVIVVFFLGLALMAALEMGLAWIFAHTLYSGWWQSLLALTLTLVGAALVIWSVRTLYVLGKGTPAPMVATQQLVRAGPYRYSRNPMTLGAGLFYLGLAAWAGSWIVFVLVLLIFISLLTYIYIHETQELAERFGVEYLQYRNRSPFSFPASRVDTLAGLPAKATMPAALQTAPVSDAVRARQTLSAVRHFVDLPEDVFATLVARMIPCKFNAGQVICLEGEPGEKIYILEKGWVKAVRTAVDGREQAAMFLRGGELFGDEAVFTGAAYPVTVIALENISAWALEGSVLLELVQRYPPLAMAVIRHLGERVLYFVQLVEDLGLRNVQARVAHTLLTHAELKDGQLIIPRQTWTTLDEMATRLGTVRDVLSRTLNTLEADGILRMERTKIIIIDPQKLLERGRV